MEKFTVLEGVAAPLRVVNVDTDMIIPKQYLKTIKRTGLGKGLFSEKRYKDDGSENPDFVLNKPAYRNAKILDRGANATLTIDLEKQEIRGPDGGVIKFEIDAFRKHCMLNGLDDIGLTMAKKDNIGSYESKAKTERPWL
jgi:3-isopropylmalate/(R)-2-methylmalate dehydratase small subunit